MACCLYIAGVLKQKKCRTNPTTEKVFIFSPCSNQIEWEHNSLLFFLLFWGKWPCCWFMKVELAIHLFSLLDMNTTLFWLPLFVLLHLILYHENRKTTSFFYAWSSFHSEIYTGRFFCLVKCDVTKKENVCFIMVSYHKLFIMRCMQSFLFVWSYPSLCFCCFPQSW